MDSKICATLTLACLLPLGLSGPTRAQDAGSRVGAPKLVPESGRTGSESFGWAVAVHGGSLFVEAPLGEDATLPGGAVYVYETGTLTLQGRIAASNGR